MVLYMYREKKHSERNDSFIRDGIDADESVSRIHMSGRKSIACLKIEHKVVECKRTKLCNHILN